MADITKYPLEDGYETTLAQGWDGQVGTITVNKSPSFTFPAGVTTYIVVDPLKTNMQIAEIDAFDSGLKTIDVSNITLEKGASIPSVAVNHSVGAKVIISDNFQFWQDILTAVNSKAGLTEVNILTAINTFVESIVTEKGVAATEYASTAARDAALGGNGAATLAYTSIKAGSIFYNYNTSTAQWEAIDTGTVTPDASTTVAGKLEISEDSELTTPSSDTGGTGAFLSAKISQLIKLLGFAPTLTSSEEDDLFAFSDTSDSTKTKKITKANLRDDLSSSTSLKGTVQQVTGAENSARTNNTKFVTPLNLAKQGIIVSDNLKISADTERTNSLDSLIKQKEICVGFYRKGGTIRVKVDGKQDGGGGVNRVELHINGVFDTFLTPLLTGYSTFTEDIAVEEGDLIQIFTNGDNSPATTVSVKNFRLYYDEVDFILDATVNLD